MTHRVAIFKLTGFHKAQRREIPVQRLVYARHGRELMWLRSPVSVPCNVVKRNKITNRRQGRYREVRSEGSRCANLWTDEQKRHIRPSFPVSYPRK